MHGVCYLFIYLDREVSCTLTLYQSTPTSDAAGLFRLLILLFSLLYSDIWLPYFFGGVGGLCALNLLIFPNLWEKVKHQINYYISELKRIPF